MDVYSLVVGAIQENCYIAVTQANRAVIVDPGDDADYISSVLKEKKLTPAAILLTHGHFDHIGAVKELAAAWNVSVYAAKAEEKLLGSGRLNRAGFRYGNDERFEVTADVWLEDGDRVTVDELEFTVIATPGHTAGSVCYQCDAYIFSGDCLFAGDIGRCDLYSSDYAAMLNSLEKLKQLPGDYRVLPGHGPTTLLSREKAHNPYMTGEML